MWVHPARRELELAFPEKDAGISSPSLPHGTQPQRATIAPRQGTQQPSLQHLGAVPGAGGGEGSEGDVSLLCPVGFQHWRGAVQGAVPSHSSPARRWGSPLLFPCWGLGQAVFGQSQRRDGQRREGTVLPAASRGRGALQQGPAGAGAPRKWRQSLALQCWLCHVALSAMPPGERDARGQEQLCTCPALVFRNPAFPWGCSCPKLGREDGAWQCGGSAVA